MAKRSKSSSLGRFFDTFRFGQRNRKKGCAAKCCNRRRTYQFEPLEERALLSVAPLSNEWLINSYTTGTQELADTGNAIAAMPNGGYVVSWTSDGQDGSAKGVYAQRFNPTGNPLGNEFRVNSTTVFSQQCPSVATAADGSFVVVWESYLQDGILAGVYGQRYDAAGQLLGGEFRVNETTLGQQGTPAVACLNNGGFVVVWSGLGNGDLWGVFGRHYDAAGQAVGGEFLINTETSNLQLSPAVAALPDGGFLAAWQSHGGQDGDGTGIFAQRFDSSCNHVGSEFLVNTTTNGQQQYPAIGVDTNGRFTIAWQGNGQDGSGYGIFAQRFEGDCQKLGSEFQVNTTTDNDQLYPSVAYNSNGGFVVSWSGKGSGDSHGVFIREYNVDGVALGNESLVNQTTNGTQKFASVAAAGSGYVATWSGNGAGDNDGIFLRRLGSAPTTSGIANEDVLSGRYCSTIDLWSAFGDEESADLLLTYTVVGNTNPDLFLSVENDPTTGQLMLYYAIEAAGTSELTVRATDLGGLSVETTFTVKIGCPDEDPTLYWNPLGGSTVWSTSAPNWTSGTYGTGTRYYWPNNGSYEAAFGYGSTFAGSTVNISGSIVVQNILFYAPSTYSSLIIGGGQLTPFSSATAVYVDSSYSLYISSAISGTNKGLTKVGAGTLRLYGTNTYTGVTSIQDGTLGIYAANALPTGTIVSMSSSTNTFLNLNNFSRTISVLSGNSSSNVNLGSATLTINGTSSSTYAGVIGGTGGLIKQGTSTLTLSGNNTYSGNTRIYAGTLSTATPNSLPGYSAGKVSVYSGGTIAVQAGGSGWDAAHIDTLKAGVSWAASGASLGIDTKNGNFSYDSNISGNLGLTKLGANILTLGGTNSFNGPTKVDGGVLALGAANSLPSGAAVTLTNANGVALNLNGFDRTINSIQGGGSSGGNIALGTGTLTINNSTSNTYAGSISGSGNLIKQGAGTLIFTGTNTYSGLTSINAGTLQLGDGTTNGSIAGDISNNTALVVNNASSLNYSGNLSGSGTLTKSGTGMLTLFGTNASFTGLTSVGAGILLAATTGSLPGYDDYHQIAVSSNAAVGARVGDSGWTEEQIATLRDNVSWPLTGAALTVDVDTGSSYSCLSSLDNPSGAAIGLIKTGAGSLTLSTANGYTGLTTVSGGTLAYGTSNAISNGGVTVNGGTLDLATYSDTVGIVTLISGSIVADPVSPGLLTSTGTFEMQSGVVSARLDGSSIALNKTTSGAVTFLAQNTYTGLTTISAGTLQLGDDTTKGSVVGNITNNAALVFHNATTQGYDGVIDGSGTLTKDGEGTLTLNSANSYQGLTTINRGTLTYGADNVIYTGGITVNGGTLDLDEHIDSVGAVTLTSGSIVGGGTLSSTSGFTVQSGTIDTVLADSGGSIGLTKTGSGIVTFLKGNTYTGVTNINSGTLTYEINDAISTGGVTINGGILNLDDHSDSVGAVTLNSGNIVGSGTLTSTSSFTVQSGDINVDLVGSTDAVSLTKNGDGIVTLSSPTGNTFTGTTTITVNAGVLIGARVVDLPGYDSDDKIVANGGAVGGRIGGSGWNEDQILTLRNNVRWPATGAALVLDTSNGSFSYTGGLADPSGVSLGLVKMGSNTLTLNVPNSYTGLTTITGGTLAYGTNDVIATGGVTINGGALGLGTYDDTVGAVTLVSGSITGSGTLTSTSGFTVQSGTIDVILNGGGSVGLMKDGYDTVTLANANTYAGGTTVSGGTLQLGNGTTANGSVVGNIAVFNATLAFNNPSNENYGGVISGSYGTLTKSGAGTLTLLGGNNCLPNTLTVTINAGTLDLSSYNNTVRGVTLVDGSITGSGILTSNSHFAVQSGSISIVLAGGAGITGLTKTGSGTVTLDAANTFTGFTTVSGGTLAYGVDNAVSTGDVRVSGGTLDVGSHCDTVGAVTVSNNGSIAGTTGVLTSTGVFTVNTSSTTTISANLAGNVSLTKGGSGILTMSGTNRYSGPTTVNTGTLCIGDGTKDGSLTGNISLAAGTTLTFNNASTAEYSGIISGDGAVTKTGVGRLTLSGANDYTGLTTVCDGTLALGADNVIRDGNALILNSGTIDVDSHSDSVGTLAIGNGSVTGTTGVLTATNGYMASGTAAISATLGGTAGLMKNGPGTLTFTGNNIYAGTITVNGGTLQLGDGATSGTVAGNICLGANTSLVFNNASESSYGGAISGSGTVAKEGTGIFTLNGTSNNYSGGTAIMNGTLKLGVDNALPASTVIAFGSSASSGVLELNGHNQQVGGLAVGAGATAISQTIGNSSTGQNATLFVNSADSWTFGGTIQDKVIGSGGYHTALVKSGTGTLSLTGTNNSYMGGTTVDAGMLYAGTAGALPNNSTAGSIAVNDGGVLKALSTAAMPSYNVSGAITVNNGGTIAVNASAGEWVANNIQTLLDMATFNNGSALGIDTTNAGAGGFTYPNSIGNQSGRSRGLTKLGENTLTLSGTTNDYTGTTTVGGGILTYTSVNSIAAGDITVDGGTLNLSSFSKSVGLVTLANGSITGTGSSTLTSSSGFVVQSGTVGVRLAGSGGLTKTGEGTVSLTATSNSYGGNTTISQGTLSITDIGQLGTGTNPINFGDSTYKGTLSFTQTTDFPNCQILHGITINAGGGEINAATSGSYLEIGDWSAPTPKDDFVGGLLTIGGDGTVWLYDCLNDAPGMIGSLAKVGHGDLYLTASNTFSGTTAVEEGALHLSGLYYGNAYTLQNSTFIGGGGSLVFDYGGGAADNEFTFGGLVGATNINLQTPSLDPVLLSVGHNNNSTEYQGTLSGPGSLIKVGTGTLTLSGANTFTGTTTINTGGMLNLKNPNALQNSTFQGGAGGTLAFDSSVQNHGFTWGGLAGSGNINLQDNASNAIALSVGNNDSDTAYSGTIGGSGSLIKTGSGTLAFTNVTAGNNYSYSGGTTINEGILIAKNQYDLPTNGAIVVNDGAAVGGQVSASGGTTGWTQAGIDALCGSVTWNAGSALALDTSLGNFSFNGSNMGSYGLTKLGANTLTLNGGTSNDYTGDTTILAGTLTLGDANSVPDTSDVIVKGSGVLNLNGHNETVGLVAVASNNTTTSAITGSGVLTSSGFTFQNGWISATLAGSAGNLGLTKMGSGTVRLSGTDNEDHSLNVTINGGNLKFDSISAIPAGANNITINVGGTLNAEGAYSTFAGWLTTSNKINTASTGTLALRANDSADLNMGSYDKLFLGATGGKWIYSGTLTPAGLVYRLGGSDGKLEISKKLTDVNDPTSLVVRGDVILDVVSDYSGGTTVKNGNNSYTLDDPPQTAYAELSARLPAITDYLDPTVSSGPTSGQALAPNVSVATGASTVSVNAIDNTSGCSACGTGVGGLSYNSRNLGLNTGFGAGWSDAALLPIMTADSTCSPGFSDGWGGKSMMTMATYTLGSTITIRRSCPQQISFVGRFSGNTSALLDASTDSVTNFVPLCGAQQTLTDNTTQGLFTLQDPDGSTCQFWDFYQTTHPQGAFYRSVSANGETTTAYYNDDGTLHEIEYCAAGSVQPYKELVYGYYENGDTSGNITSVTLWGLASSTTTSLSPIRKQEYIYYDGINYSTFGSAGDLQKVITKQQWNGSAFVDSNPDTYYFRYFTSGSATHELKRVLLPQAYAMAVASEYGQQHGAPETWLGDTQEDPIANFTCFYYEYGTNHRVAKEVVFGKSNEYTFTYSADALGYHASDKLNHVNDWSLWINENLPDGSTNKIYTNSLGQVLLSDLTVGASHTITYNQYTYDYNSQSNGQLLFCAEPTAILTYTAYDNGYLAPSSTYTGLVHVYRYSTSMYICGSVYLPTGQPDGYLESEWVRSGWGDAYGLYDPRYAKELRSYTYDTLPSYAASSYDVVPAIHPLRSVTEYPTAGGPGIETHYRNQTQYTNSIVLKQQEIDFPTIDDGQNGSGIGATGLQYYDAGGRLIWQEDARGTFTYNHYDATTGRLDYTIEDIDQSQGIDLPVDWRGDALPTSGHLNARTDYWYDALGRVVQILGPAHYAIVGGLDSEPQNIRSATWTIYGECVHQTWTAEGYVLAASPTVGYLVGPVSIKKTDRDGRVTNQIQATYMRSGSPDFDVSHLQSDLADFLNGGSDPFPQTSFVTWTANTYKNTRLWATAVYYHIPTATTVNGDGFVGSGTTDYTVTNYRYEADYLGGGSTSDVPNFKGRLNKVVADDGTITRVVYDARGNVTKTYVGADDTGATDADPSNSGANSMKLVSWNHYDFDQSGGDGLLTRTDSYFDDTHCYSTYYQYDSRDRLVGTLTPDGVAMVATLNNLGRTIQTDTYAGATYNSGTHQIVTSSGNLRAEVVMKYNDLDQVYESDTYCVNPTNGTLGDYLPTYVWYDAAGQVIKTQTGTTGAFTKYAYDSLGRLVFQYIGYDTNETTSDLYDSNGNATLDLTDDTILEQNQTWYDDTGETVATATYQQFGTGTLVTGILTAANSYTTATANWYDGIGRVVETANYGRDDTGITATWVHYFFDNTGDLIDASPADGIPDVAQSIPPQPYTAERPDSRAGYDYNLQQIVYDSAGRPYQTIDNLGRIDETLYDAAGRTVITIQNYDPAGLNGVIYATDDDATVAAKLKDTSTDKDVIVKYDYDAKGRLATLVAYNAKGAGHGVEQQMTRYLYDDSTTALNHAWQTGVVYPDSTDTISGPDTNRDWTITAGTDHTSATYDRLGRTTTATDQRRIVHTYIYDTAGRLSEDQATAPYGWGDVDSTVQAIVTAYDGLGRVQTVTSYNNPTTRLPGNVLNQILDEYDGWGNLVKEYQNHDGLVDVPNSPHVQYAYDDGADADGRAAYLRLDKVTYPNGREVHYNYSAGVDAIMSRLGSISESDGTVDASYTYRGLSKIISEDYEQARVVLNQTSNSWLYPLDRLGRTSVQAWWQYDAADNLTQQWDITDYGYDRAGNVLLRIEEYTARPSSQGPISWTWDSNGFLYLPSGCDYDWVDYDAMDRLQDNYPYTGKYDSVGNDLSQGTYNVANEKTPTQGSSGYDLAGNMTTLRSGATAKYDAWNRLNEITDMTGTLEKYIYDGAGRRIRILSDYSGGVAGKVTDQYLSGQHVVETHENGAIKYQYVWSPRYIDAPILRDTYSSGVIQPAERIFYLSDGNYNVTAILGQVNGQWQVVERYDYTPWGVVTVLDGNAAARTVNVSQFGNTILYTGREYSFATGLYYYRARFYDPVLQRFVGRDPILYFGSDNLYSYCNDGPTRFVDPLGLAPQDHHWFPRFGGNGRGQAMVNAKCNGTAQFNIDEFTTTMEASKDLKGAHWWLTNVFRYNEWVSYVYNHVQNCCQLLLAINDLRQFSFEEMGRRGIRRPQPWNLHPWGKPGVSTDSRLAQLIACACLDSRDRNQDVVDKLLWDASKKVRYIRIVPPTLVDVMYPQDEIRRRFWIIIGVEVGLGAIAISGGAIMIGGAAIAPVAGAAGIEAVGEAGSSIILPYLKAAGWLMPILGIDEANGNGTSPR